MLDIQAVVDTKLQKMLADGSIADQVQAGIAKAVNSALDDQFGYHGAVNKALKEAMKEGLKLNTKDLPFQSYNEQMLVAIKQKMGNMFAGQASERFLAEIEKTLAPAPSEMSINELVELVVADWKTDEPWDASDLDDYATVEFEENDGCMSGTYKLQMWKQRESGGYSSRTNRADLHLHISGDTIRISHNQSYNPTCFSEHEAMIFKLYAAGTKITGCADFDPDDCDLMLKESEY